MTIAGLERSFRGLPGRGHQGRIFLRPPSPQTLPSPCSPFPRGVYCMGYSSEAGGIPTLLFSWGCCCACSLLGSESFCPCLRDGTLPSAPSLGPLSDTSFSPLSILVLSPLRTSTPLDYPSSPVSSENGAKETTPFPLRPCSYRVRSGSCIHLSAKEMHRTCHCFLNVKVSLPCFSY